jgi:hypothetical protein
MVPKSSLFIALNITFCFAENYEIKQKNEIQISQNLKIKIDKILLNFYEKLDKKFNKISDKINILEKINAKIEILKNKKFRNKKVVKILNYMQNNISKKIKEYKSLSTEGFNPLNNELNNKINFNNPISPKQYQKNIKF